MNLNLQGVGVSSGGGGAIVNGGAGAIGDVNVIATGANTITTTGVANNYGIAILTGPGTTAIGNMIVDATAAISVSGAADIRGIFVNNQVPNSPANLTINYTGPSIDVTAQFEAAGIHARSSSGSGNVSITANGNITGIVTAFPPLVGIFAEPNNSGTGSGNGSIRYTSGTVDITGPSVNGIVALNRGSGSSTITTDPGTTVIVTGDGTNSPGSAISAQSLLGTAAAGASVVANIASEIRHTGYAGGGLRAGIRTYAGVDAPITVNYSGPGITTIGDNGLGILALSRSGTVSVTSSGPISTNGVTSFGIRADSGTLANLASLDPGDTFGAVAGPLGIGEAVTVNATAPITTIGREAQGIWASSASGPTLVNVAQVTTTGQFSSAVRATGASVAVNVAAGGSVMGGWQPGVNDVGTSLGLPSAGVSLHATGGPAVLTNNGTIGALSDRAVFGDPTIINNGTMTGFVQLAGINSYINNGTFALRHFADTNGDGIRDTLRVALSDLGSGPSTFANNGRLALLGGPGATVLDNTGQYLPFGLAVNSMALGGPMQGQILGATTFTNSGVIDLQANAVAGDVLVISGGRTPGVSGGGTFVSNGGALLLDTVLNAGGSTSRSDILVVDGTQVGAAGATRVSVRNAGGAGALTVGDGIPVVQNLDPARSAAGAFALSGLLAAGPYQYLLFQGGVGADANDGNWYLRSMINCSLEPSSPVCPAPTPNPTPNFRTETSLYAAIPSMALLYGRSLLDTLHERVGEEEDQRRPFDPNNAKVGWGRVIGVNGHQSGDAAGILGSGPSYNYTFLGLQAGMDVFRRDLPDGSRDQAGAYFAIGSDQGRVTHFDSSQGNSNFNAYSLGGYWTHFGASGWYTDMVLQGTFYDINSSANRGLPALRTVGQGVAASIEGGYPFRFAGGYFIEPQAQLIYQTININDTNDIAARIRFSDVDSAAARIGARFGRTWAVDDSYRTITAWIRPNLWNEFRGNPITSFSSETGFVPFHADLGGLWGEVNLGVSGQITTMTTLYANASYSSRFDSGGFAYNGKVGLRVNW